MVPVAMAGDVSDVKGKGVGENSHHQRASTLLRCTLQISTHETSGWTRISSNELMLFEHPTHYFERSIWPAEMTRDLIEGMGVGAPRNLHQRTSPFPQVPRC